MKKLLLPLCSLFIMTSMFNNNVSAQIDNLRNLSAEWVRSPARNAATDATDIVVYNPAGLTKLKDGLHINLGNQFLFRNPTHEYDLGLGGGPKTFSQGSADLFLPNLYAAYKKDNWALFTGVFNAGGGATADYPHGSITTDLIALQTLKAAGGAYTATTDQMLKATSIYLATTLGGSYAINDGISVSLAGRYISAKNTDQAGMTLTASPLHLPDKPLSLDADYTATGFGGVIGVNITAIEHLDLSVRYETQVNLNFKTKVNTDDFGLTQDGATNRRDLPAVFAFGAAYELNSKLKASADFNYYFQKNANWGTSSMLTADSPYAALAGNAYVYALAFQYQATSQVQVSIGTSFTRYNFSNEAGYYTDLGAFEIVKNNNYSLNTGLAYKINEKVTLNVGYLHVFYAKDQMIPALLAYPLNVNVTVNNATNVIAVGADLTFGSNKK